MGRKPKDKTEPIGDDEFVEPIEPIDEEPKAPFVPPADTTERLPYDDDRVLEIVNLILDPKGVQKLQFTEVEVSWIRSLIKTDLTNYAITVARNASNPKFDWLDYNKSLGYRETNEILLPTEIAQYSLARWQRAKSRKLIKDAHELAVSAGAETEEARLMRTAFKG